jgi:hypothetical protein
MLTASPRATLVALVAIVLVSARVTTEPASSRPDLSGRWQLNTALSENAQAKLERLHASASGHGPGRHGGGSVGPSAQMSEMRARLLNPAAWFVLTRDGDRITVTESDGHVLGMTANGEKARIGDHDVRTRWD